MAQDEDPSLGLPPRPGTRQARKVHWARKLIPLVILILGAGGMILLVKSRRAPQRKPRIKKPLLVEVRKVAEEQREVQIASNGVIQPRQEVSISPQVSGKVRWIHPSLVVGGMLRAKAVMLRLESMDYKLTVDKARAAVARTEKDLAMAESSARVARTEWDRMGRRTPGAKATPLTLHAPQLKAAQSNLASARADLEMTKLNLRRTVIRAPFNLRIRKKNVDQGQYVRVGQELARVYGTDVAEVIVPLPVSELRWLEVPRQMGKKRKVTGPRVTVRLKTGKKVFERQGVLVRSVGEVDATGRMSKVVVAITDPYNLKKTATRDQVDFEIGAFVEVALRGKTLERVIPIPSEALRVGAVAWVVDGDSKLRIRPVTTIRRTETEVLVSSGLKAGDQVVISNVTGAVEGMKLRIRPVEKKKALRTEARRP